MQRVLPSYHYWFFLGLLLSGCTNLSIESETNRSVSFDPLSSKEDRRKVSIVYEKDFYFFGFVPETHALVVDELVAKAGYQSLSRARIEEKRTLKNTLISIISLGMWVPKEYRLHGYAK